ncbi:MAG TPA: hypothetical protein VFV86_00570 [Nitrososphaeraceae archaeon]|nr:hypothetical protein [Nitrososphaeraceae archaeon]
MNKTIIILLGLLVVLLPFGKSNIISNANAIATEDEYYTDQYERYGNDEYYSDRSSYGKSNYEREYPSFKSDYKKDERSYGYEDNKYKSNDKERNIVSISNINCNTVNYNFNNVVIGNFSNGNSGIGGAAAASADGINGALNTNANGNNEGYNNGYQKGKDITCIANINNNNTNISTGAASNATNGNATDGGNDNATDPCVECFLEILNEDQIAEIETFFENGGLSIELDLLGTVSVTINSFEEFCVLVETVLDLGIGIDSVFFYVDQLVSFVADDNEITELTDCIEEALGIETDSNGIVAPFDINTKPSDFQSNTKGSLTSLGVHNEGTGNHLTAMEKVIKLKQQWLNQLP